MRPHMAHINNTMIRKQLANEAGNKEATYRVYKNKVAAALESGFSKDNIIAELEAEKERIKQDLRAGDGIFLQGVANAQNACMASIALIISELKGEQNAVLH